MTELIDISLPISAHSVVWPSAPRPRLERRLSIDRGDSVNDSNLFMNVHTGTHIDAPLHHIRDGKSVDEIQPDTLVGEAWVLDMGEHRRLTTHLLEQCWPSANVRRVLFKTKNSRLWGTSSEEFASDYSALAEDTGEWLVDRNVSLVGIDYLSIQLFGDSPTVHKVLLEAGVVLLEGLNLSNVVAGRYELMCLPLKLRGADGAPARAVLRRIS